MICYKCLTYTPKDKLMVKVTVGHVFKVCPCCEKRVFFYFPED